MITNYFIYNLGCVNFGTSFIWCARHGIYLTDGSPVAGIYRQA